MAVNIRIPDRAFARAVELEEEGADIIDIGAESTHPGASPHFRRRGATPPHPGPEAFTEQAEQSRSLSTRTRRRGREGARAGRGNHQRSERRSPSTRTSRAKWARRAPALIVNHMRGSPETWLKLPPLKDVIRTIVSGIGRIGASCRARRSRSPPNRNRSRHGLRQTEGTERRDPGAPPTISAPGASGAHRTVAQTFFDQGIPHRNRIRHCSRRNCSDPAWSASGPRSRREIDEGGGRGGRRNRESDNVGFHETSQLHHHSGPGSRAGSRHAQGHWIHR